MENVSLHMWGVLIAGVAVGLIALAIKVFMAGKKGEEAGEITQKANDAIAEIQAAVAKGDDAAVQAALLKHLKDSK